jgi:hypothetical protein
MSLIADVTRLLPSSPEITSTKEGTQHSWCPHKPEVLGVKKTWEKTLSLEMDPSVSYRPQTYPFRLKNGENDTAVDTTAI